MSKANDVDPGDIPGDLPALIQVEEMYSKLFFFHLPSQCTRLNSTTCFASNVTAIYLLRFFSFKTPLAPRHALPPPHTRQYMPATLLLCDSQPCNLTALESTTNLFDLQGLGHFIDCTLPRANVYLPVLRSSVPL